MKQNFKASLPDPTNFDKKMLFDTPIINHTLIPMIAHVIAPSSSPVKTPFAVDSGSLSMSSPIFKANGSAAKLLCLTPAAPHTAAAFLWLLFRRPFGSHHSHAATPPLCQGA
jgi:hypothetical protein